MRLCGNVGWVEVVLVPLSWTTASRHGVVAHHRYERARPANRGQPLQKAMAGCPNQFEPLCYRKIDRTVVLGVEGQSMR
jgi:hypothetical protein